MGRERRRTVRQIAVEGDIDLDEALVVLWDVGFDDLLSPESYIGRRDLNRARRALGLATRRELESPEYWMSLLDLSPEALAELLHGTGFEVGGGKRRLPRKAISRLKAQAAGVGLDPVTGDPLPEDPLPQAPLDWVTPGHTREPNFLTVEDVETIHWALVEELATSEDPIDPPGVRSESLLGSAVFRPHTSLGNQLKYPTLETSAAALLHAIVQDHTFFNGNKRTALVSFLVFLEQNGLCLECSEDELFKLVLQVAQHRIAGRQRVNRDDREVLAIAEWLCARSRLVEKGERPIPWRRLRRILTAHGCEMEFPGGVGNRINISRRRVVRGIFGRYKDVRLSTQVFYAGEGREVQVDTIKKVRSDLDLDYESGVDSRTFYDREPVQAGDFIAKYRLTLQRLAKL